MNTAQQIRILLSEHLPQLKTKYPIETLALFGSVLRNDFVPGKSDVDILVDFNGSIGIEFIDLADELETLVKTKVDLVTKGGLSKKHWEYLKERIQYV